MSTISAADKKPSSAYEAAKPLDHPSDDIFLPNLENIDVPEILTPFICSAPPSPGTNNQLNNVSDAVVVVDGGTPFHQPVAADAASIPPFQEIIKQLQGSSDQPAPINALPPAVHEDNNGFLVVQPPPQNDHQQNHLLQAIVDQSMQPPRVCNNTAFQQTPIYEGGFGQPISGVSFSYQANPFPPPLNQDQYFFHGDTSNPRIDDQHPYSSYDLQNQIANSSHALNTPVAWPPLPPDHVSLSMPNCSSDQRPEISPLPSTSHVAFAGAQGGQHINNFVPALTENSLVLQNGSHPHQWTWDFDQSFSMEVVEDAIPLEIIPSSSSNGGVEDKKMKKKQVRWTVAEHKAMLQGIQKYGKGHWKSISREFVMSKSPIQIASHYQKYDARQKGDENTEGTREHKRKKRKSIHDITMDDLGTSNGTA